MGIRAGKPKNNLAKAKDGRKKVEREYEDYFVDRG